MSAGFVGEPTAKQKAFREQARKVGRARKTVPELVLAHTIECFDGLFHD